ncbi:3-hydroxyacyl-CoA dehydrogenase family protein [Streptomyces sp. NPDC086010]|uniref:3-hydroxyacyl-CoA dehydrogenase family protein n=1 Tax=Streptomyces sp. NPDC086010 TaxID=3365745 RepID=UPI0037CF0BAC
MASTSSKPSLHPRQPPPQDHRLEDPCRSPQRALLSLQEVPEKSLAPSKPPHNRRTTGHRAMRNAAQLYAEYKEPLYAAPPLLQRMVDAGRLGRNTGSGFYPY